MSRSRTTIETFKLTLKHKGNSGSRSTLYDYVYVFFAHSSKDNLNYKYIIKAEAYNDCYAIKFYPWEQRDGEHKYENILNRFNYIEAKKIMQLCCDVIKDVHQKHDKVSFCFMASQTIEKDRYIEDIKETQRFRIYTEIIKKEFSGIDDFAIYLFPEASCCFFVNKDLGYNPDEIMNNYIDLFTTIFDIEL